MNQHDPDDRSGDDASRHVEPEPTAAMPAWSGPDAVPTDTPTAAMPYVEGATPAGSAAAAGAAPAGATPGAPTSPRRRRALIIAGAIVLLVALVAGIAWWISTASAEARDTAIRETATRYLTAVAEGDAGAALDTLADPPANRTLLTDEVLQASAATAPLHDVQVTGVTNDERNATASVTYALGDLPVEVVLPLVGDGRTSWHIADGTSDLMVNQTQALTVNGATLTDGTNPVFPGTYTAAPSSDLLTLTGEATAVVPSPEHPVGRITVTHELSETGRQRVFDTVKGQFDQCLAATESRPANCPFGVDDSNAQVTPGSVRFELLNDPWATFAPTIDLATMTARGTFPLQVNASANVTFEGRTGDVSIGLTGDRSWSVDLTKEPLTVVWQ